MIKRHAHRRSLQLATLLALTTGLIGCGSGSSGGSPTLSDGDTSGSPLPVSARNGLPDLAAVDLITSAGSAGGLSASVTIANGGQGPAVVDDAWLLVSADPGFTSNYHYVPVTLRSQTLRGDQVLEPGESEQFNVGTGRGDGIYVVLQRSGMHYARLWVNPDRSARFVNPEDHLVESHAMPELDYTNNLSPEAAFDNGSRPNGGPDCVVDPYEENETLESATPIAFDQIYELNGCDDLTEVLTVDFEAGGTYEVMEHESALRGLWELSVIDPDGRYLTRRTATRTLVTAQQGGPHYLVATYQSPALGGTLTLEITGR